VLVVISSGSVRNVLMYINKNNSIYWREMQSIAQFNKIDIDLYGVLVSNQVSDSGI